MGDGCNLWLCRLSIFLSLFYKLYGCFPLTFHWFPPQCTKRLTSPPLTSQSPPGDPRWTRRTDRCTRSCLARRWTATSRAGASWSMASTTATSTAPRSTPSTRWWTPGRSASWTSTRRWVSHSPVAGSCFFLFGSVHLSSHPQ